jgi:NAD(P)-dependent dehydrogenase (short-subunit alcohol dehydrogenase family)
MMSYFKDKVIVLTGGASGMGLVTAKLLASHGAKISIADIQEKQLRQAKSDIETVGGTCMVHVTDVQDEHQVGAWIEATVSAYGKIDGVANFAAVIGKDIMVKATEDITTEDWNFVLGVNLTGLMNCLRAQIPHLKSGSAVVNFASVSGQRGFENNGAYCASKHGVIGLSRCTAKELGPKGIRLNIVAPSVAPELEDMS